MVKTFLRRPGNKSKHLKHIIPLIQEFTGTYYEPLLGTGAVYLNLLQKKAVLNDLNTDIVNIWKLVKSDQEFIISEIDKFKKKFLHLNNTEKLKMCKEIVANMETYVGKQRTINYLLMIYCSFNGTVFNNKGNLYISGLNGHIYDNESCHIFTGNYKEKIKELEKILKNVKLENKDYTKILEKTKNGDFVFLDPPYIEEKKYVFNYNKDDIFDINALKKDVEKLDRKQVRWMMTQIDTTQVREIFKKYRMYPYENNSNYRTGPVIKKELVIANY